MSLQKRFTASLLFIIPIILISGFMKAQTSSEGRWDYILGKYEEREHVYAICVDQEYVYLGGNFDHSNEYGGTGVKGIARYTKDGLIDEVGGGVHGDGFEVRAICPTQNGLVIGGHFVMAGQTIVNHVAFWNGETWEALAGGVNNTVYAVSEFKGDIYAGGIFTRVNGQRLYYLARWNGTEWSAVGGALDGPVHSMIVYQDKLVVGGRFIHAGSLAVDHLALWNGTEWSGLGGGTNGNVLAMAVQGNNLVIGGRFETAGGVNANKIARWTGSAFEPVGQGLMGNVLSVAVDGDYIYAGGEFSEESGSESSLNYIARWNGSAWQALDGGLDAPVNAIAIQESDVFMGGKFCRPSFWWWADEDHYHFIRWRNPVPDTPFKRHLETPFDGRSNFSLGLAWVDYNNDGDQDILIPDADQSIIFSNENGVFNEIKSNPLWWRQREYCSWADYDNDGDEDFIAVGDRYPSSFFKAFNVNQGDGTFQESDIFDFGPTYTVWDGLWGDFNNDGYSDYVINHYNPNISHTQQILMYDNIQGDHFSYREVFGYRDSWMIPHWGSMSWCDVDNDGDIDLLHLKNWNWWSFYMLYPSSADLFLNEGGQLTKADAGDLTSDLTHGSHAAWGDYDNDGDFDVFIANQKFENNLLYTNQGGGIFRRASVSPVTEEGGVSKVGNWVDYDNDGDLDLFVLTENHGDNFMYENQGDGTFEKLMENQFTNIEEGCFFSAWHDYDRDGDCDLVMLGQRQSQIFMLENMQDTGNHWLNLTLVGVKSNRDAMGAKVHAKAVIDGSLVIQTREVNGQVGWGQNSREVVLGLGNAASADIIIEWPSGITQELGSMAADQFVTVTEDTTSTLGKKSGLSARDMLEYDLLPESTEELDIPVEFSLSPCYPNPFNPSTEIAYALPRESGVNMRIINARGEVIFTLVQERQSAGCYQVRWNGQNESGNAMSSGLYFCRIETSEFVSTQKLILVR